LTFDSRNESPGAIGLLASIRKFQKTPPAISFSFSAVGFLLTSVLILPAPAFGFFCLQPLAAQTSFSVCPNSRHLEDEAEVRNVPEGDLVLMVGSAQTHARKL
jgi:hypothetical protein